MPTLPFSPDRDRPDQIPNLLLLLVSYIPLANLASKFIDKNTALATAERRQTCLLRLIAPHSRAKP